MNSVRRCVSRCVLQSVYRPAQVPAALMDVSTNLTPIIDRVSGSSSAFGFKLLNSSYSGNAVLLRRSSDNAEQAFGFVGNAFDSASFTSWIGASTAYCKTWYDQSGNSRNATQTTTTKQPIFSLEGGTTPVLTFDGTDDFLSMGNVVITGTNGYHVAVSFKTSNAQANEYPFIAKYYNNGVHFFGFGTGSKLYFGIGAVPSSNAVLSDSAINTGARAVVQGNYDKTAGLDNMLCRKDHVTQGAFKNTTIAFPTNTDYCNIGALGDSGGSQNYYNGKLYGLITYPNSLSDLERDSPVPTA